MGQVRSICKNAHTTSRFIQEIIRLNKINGARLEESMKMNMECCVQLTEKVKRIRSMIDKYNSIRNEVKEMPTNSHQDEAVCGEMNFPKIRKINAPKIMKPQRRRETIPINKKYCEKSNKFYSAKANKKYR